jgi:hypothetical protein
MIDPRLDYVHVKTRRRLVFSAIHLLLYFSFALNWSELGNGLRQQLGDGPMTGSMLMFVILVLSFLAIECVFLLFDRDGAK